MAGKNKKVIGQEEKDSSTNTVGQPLNNAIVIKKLTLAPLQTTSGFDYVSTPTSPRTLKQSA